MPAGAQTPTPTPEQIRMFQSLPPDQQQALLEQFGLTGDGADEGLETTSSPAGASVPPQTAGSPDSLQSALRSVTELADRNLIRGGDTVLIDLQLPKDDELDVSRPLAPGAALIRQRTLAGNPYKLDKLGQLRIPGLSNPIPLAGLTAKEATTRLVLEPALAGLDVKVTLLGLDPIGVDALKPFGYGLFARVPTTFAPADDIPVPPEYTIGPGDTVKVQLIGNVKGNYSLVVGRDGEIRFPELGPVTVAGMPFNELRKLIEETVAEQMIGTRAVVGLGALRSLRVLVTGEAQKPGSFTISGLSTMTNALLASGGPTLDGSLRTIQLKRNGRTVASLDLYDLLLRGDSRNDARILSGDVLFIPPVGPTAGVTGEIRRPAIYEFKGEATAGDLVALGGGLRPEAAPQLAVIERIDPREGRVLVSVDLTTDAGRATPLRSGDILRIDAVRDTLHDSVTLAGHVYRPRATPFRAGSRLTDLIPGVEDLRPNADLNYVLIRRESSPDRQVVALSADLAAAWRAPASAANPVLNPRDQVFVFDREADRAVQLEALLADLRRQSTNARPTQIVNVDGSVKMPGTYPLEAGMRVSDLVRAGGSLDEAAFGASAELARYEVVNGETRRTAMVPIDLAAALAGDPAANLELQSFDLLTIKRVPDWGEREIITIEGEVLYPGRYAIQRGETLAAVIKRAGGLTDLAFAEGVVFTRRELREREARQIAALADRLEKDLAALALQSSQALPATAQSSTQSLSIGQSLLAELRNAEPVGRLAIDLPSVLADDGSSVDILLKDEDRLLVPRRSQEVTVLGEVQTVTSHLYQPDLARNDYVNLSGGTTQKADTSRIYVVKANGRVVAGSGSSWFRNDGNVIRPGDTIVVPVDTERLPALPLWTSVTSIIYNLAIAVAAVNSF